MSYKKFDTERDAPGKSKPVDKYKAAPVAAPPVTAPVKGPAKATPTAKS